jgi:hypothetical protein
VIISGGQAYPFRFVTYTLACRSSTFGFPADVYAISYSGRGRPVALL